MNALKWIYYIGIFNGYFVRIATEVNVVAGEQQNKK